MSSAKAESNFIPVREDWLARRKEAIIEPDLPIVDPHHHLWDRRDWRYMLDDLLTDLNSEHKIVATVFVQCRAFHRADGPDAMKPVGETEFVNGIAAMSASGRYGTARICAGIVGYADMTLGARVQEVLEAHLRAGGDRFRGIRHITAWDADPLLPERAFPAPPGLLGDATFREGFGRLAPLGLSFDAWLYHPQIGDLAALARAFPETQIVLDHMSRPASKVSAPIAACSRATFRSTRARTATPYAGTPSSASRALQVLRRRRICLAAPRHASTG